MSELLTMAEVAKVLLCSKAHVCKCREWKACGVRADSCRSAWPTASRSAGEFGPLD